MLNQYFLTAGQMFVLQFTLIQHNKVNFSPIFRKQKHRQDIVCKTIQILER